MIMLPHKAKSMFCVELRIPPNSNEFFSEKSFSLSICQGDAIHDLVAQGFKMLSFWSNFQRKLAVLELQKLLEKELPFNIRLQASRAITTEQNYLKVTILSNFFFKISSQL